MAKMELDTHWAQLTRDVETLVNKYRSIFEWDVSDIDESAADRLILAAGRQTLDRRVKVPAGAPLP